MISDKTTLKELIDIDIKNVAENLLKPNKDRINYDEESCAWYNCYTILHQKEIIGYIDEYIEEVMKIKK